MLTGRPIIPRRKPKIRIHRLFPECFFPDPSRSKAGTVVKQAVWHSLHIKSSCIMAAASGEGTEINAAAIVRNNGDTDAPVIMAIAHNTSNVSFWVAPQ